jgi:uncharacterized membrane protein (UPF0136 family)
MNMKNSAIILLIYAILVLVGGLIGHFVKGSQASLIAGLSFGLLLLANAIWMFKGKRASLYSALALIFVLDGFFTYRFAKTHAFFPSGAMSLLSLLLIFVMAMSLSRSLKKT